MKKIADEEVKRIISEAFEGVIKGKGIGIREATAIDNCAAESERQQARTNDVNQWQDITQEWKGILGDVLSFTDNEGFRFLLPAAMMAAIEGNADASHSIFFHLCLIHPEIKTRPHHGYREYVDYVRQISPAQITKQRRFTNGQIHAIAFYFLWWMQKEEEYSFGDRKRELKSRQKRQELFIEKVSPKHYNLSLEDEMNIFDEECRILQEWLIIGGIAVN